MPWHPFHRLLAKGSAKYQKARHGSSTAASSASSQASAQLDAQVASSALTPPPVSRVTPDASDHGFFEKSLPTTAPWTVPSSTEGNGNGKAAAEIARPVQQSGRQAADDALNMDPKNSLWDRAYDALKVEESSCMAAYETLLNGVLSRDLKNVSSAPYGSEDVDNGSYLIPQSDVVVRRERLGQITDLGLKHMQDKKVSVTMLGHEIILQEQVDNVISVVIWAEDYITAAVKDLPYASMVWAGVSLLLPLLKNPTAAEAANQEGFTYVTSQMRYYAAMESLLLPEGMERNLETDLSERLVDLYKLILNFQVRTILRFYRSRTKNFLREVVNYDGWDTTLKAIQDNDAALVRKFETAMSGIGLQELKRLAEEAVATRKILEEQIQVSQRQLSILQEIARLLSDPQNQACLRALRTTDPRDDKTRIEQTNGGLLRNSYRWALDQVEFQRWRHDEHSQLLWITGNPGKGKTMLLCGLINELRESIGGADLVAFFFCQATNARINSGTAVLRGLLYLLAQQQPLLLSHIQKRYKDAEKQLFEDTNSWVALTEILSDVLADPNLPETYLVVDALDECDADLPQLLDCIIRHSTSPRVKWILSSRHRRDIEQKLQQSQSHVKLSLELRETAKQVSQAVDTYIEHCISKLPSLQDDETLQTQVQEVMRQKANGTFLWVSLVVKELQDAMSWEIMDIIDEMPTDLKEVYSRMAAQIQRLKRGNPHLCRLVLSAVITAYRPLRLDELAILSGLPTQFVSKPQSVIDVVNLCASFLTVQDGDVYIIHQSVKDFFSEIFESFFTYDVPRTHCDMFSRSIEALSQTLRRDIYELQRPGFPIEQVCPPDPDPLASVRYACFYWVDHLKDSSVALRGDSQKLDEFLCHTYLHWLEALGLLKNISIGILAMAKLAEIFQRETSHLASRIRDARRFIHQHKDAIESSPLQVYASALIFSPASSMTRDTFKNEGPLWIMNGPVVEDTWTPCQQTLEGHKDWVKSVTFSPNAKLIASGSRDGTVKVWDAQTGACKQTLKSDSENEYDFPNSVAFSSDSKFIASAYYRRTIKIWDAVIGICVSTFVGHSGSVNSVAFSPDSTLLASASDDGTVKLWETATGVCTQTFKGHLDSVVCSVAFSPDSRLIASGSSDKTAKVWDTETGMCIQTLDSHVSYVYSIAFSPNSKLIASASADKTIKIWEAATGLHIQTLEGHSDSVTSVTFSHNSELIASASKYRDKSIRIWDSKTGVCTQIFQGHGDSVNSVAFSPDSKLLASASDDGTVKIWDATMSTSTQMLDSHKNRVTFITFSPDLKFVASGSSDRTIKIWSAETGICTQTLEGHKNDVYPVTFSPDSGLIASGSSDTTVKIWNTIGVCMVTLVGHSSSVISIAFSPDSRFVASGSGDGIIKIWDTMTWVCTQTIKRHNETVWSVAFSPDSRILVSGSCLEHKCVQIWDAATGICMQTLKGHDGRILSVAFSPDSKQIASSSEDNSIKIWEVAAGICVQTLDIGRELHQISFHSTGSHLQTDIGTIEIPMLATKNAVSPQDLPNPHRQGYGISLDGKWIVRGSENLLRLPPDYRPTISSAVVASTVAIGCESGRVLIMKFI